jgi:methylaspartate ammonia-lyase
MGGCVELAGVEIGTPVTLAVQQSGAGAPSKLFAGEVTAVEVELNPVLVGRSGATVVDALWIDEVVG